MVIAKDWINPIKIIEVLLFHRSHAAFRSACEHAVAGQTADVYPLIRACIEYAGYALHMSENKGLDELWLKRHDNGATIKAVKTHFTIANIRTTIGQKNRHIGKVFKELYNRTIDFGGHPNERAITGNMDIIDQDGGTKTTSLYMQKDSIFLDQALKTCAQSGIASLEILQEVFPERFELLGVRQDILILRRGL